MRLWQIVAVVGIGIAIGVFEPGRFTNTLSEATLYVFLPPLLFEAAWNLDYAAIRRQWAAIATLAGPGVLLTAAIVAGALAIAGVPLGPAFLAGAIVSATDPIAVVAVFKRLRVPKTLATIVECESLFNDAVAVALYRIALAALALGATGGGAITAIVVKVAGGAIAGAAVGIAAALAAAMLLRRQDRTIVQVAATIAVAYGAYFVADALALSGIFATIAGGIALRYLERRWLTLRIAANVNRFWDVLALTVNVLVFFLVGAALQIGSLTRAPAFVAATLIAVVVARIAVTALLLPGGYPRAWLGVVRAAGMRGALSLALALALPSSIPYRRAIVDATFVVVLATLVLAGPTVARAVGRVARAGAVSA